MSNGAKECRAALIVVDVQEDFLPPHGSLAVPNGRRVIPVLNRLLELDSWAVTVGTMDFHPDNHCSFAANCSAEGTPAVRPFDTVTFKNPESPEQSTQQTVWPKHCVQGTHGAEVPDTLNKRKMDAWVHKGEQCDREFYSGFEDVWGSAKTDLDKILRAAGVTDVYIGGLALDFCVYHTAVDAVKYGYATKVISDATYAVRESATGATMEKLESAGVSIVDSSSIINSHH
ncbi:nicotinamidase [Trichomonascus vanleenenianus]|uniref:nicotinamidase n=1 Tax=Trichomonascus vanleenenianus TaxID=2268995 RepID=UPI003ECA2C73